LLYLHVLKVAAYGT